MNKGPRKSSSRTVKTHRYNRPLYNKLLCNNE